MAKSFNLEIVTPEQRFYSGMVEIVIVPTVTGEEGYMADHTWACKLLKAGELRFRESGSKEFRRAKIDGGFVDVRGGALVFTDTVEEQT